MTFQGRQLVRPDICLREGCSRQFQCSCLLRAGLVVCDDCRYHSLPLVQGIFQIIDAAVSLDLSDSVCTYTEERVPYPFLPCTVAAVRCRNARAYLQLGNPDLHSRLDPGSYAVEIHYVLGADARICLGNVIQGVPALYRVGCIRCVRRYTGLA